MPEIALGASTTIAQYILCPLIAKFLISHPGMEVSLVGANTSHIAHDLLEKQIELAFVEGQVDEPALIKEHFIDDELVAIAAADHRWSQSGSLTTIADLQYAPLICRERGSGTREISEHFLKDAGLDIGKLNIKMELNSSEAVKSAIEADLGVGFVSQFAIRKERRLGTVGLIHVEGLKVTRQLNCLYAKGAALSEPAASFLQFARDYRVELTRDQPSNPSPPKNFYS